MDFNLSEDQKMLQTSIREFLDKECPIDKVRELEDDERGYDTKMWKKMAELGWLGVIFPEEYGGMDGDFIDLMILVEEMGRYILPSPFFSTVVLSSLPILKYGNETQKEEFLPKIANGEEIWTLAMTESSATYEISDVKLRATLEGDVYLLEGTKLFVPYAHVADRFLVIARTSDEEKPDDGVTVFIVDKKSPNIEVEVIPTSAHDKQCEVRFDRVKVPKDNVLGKIGKGFDIVNFIIQLGAVLKCAEMLGGTQAVLKMTNNYAKERIQFERPIGSFQAIQHKLADMFIEVEGLRYLVYETAWRINIGSPSDLLISMSKAKANEVYQRTCIDGIRIHGAIGFTKEEDIGLYYIRTKSAEFSLGDTDFHKRRIAIELERC
jgi:alkylation response protein AidB-like acyl-CoA dehydrogenase